MTFPVIEEDDELEEMVDPMRDWRRQSVTRQVRDQWILDRAMLFHDLLKACMGSADPKVRGLVERLVQIDEIVKVTGGVALWKELQNVQRSSDSRE